jgi:AmiR/NasT family two-component response regulator
VIADSWSDEKYQDLTQQVDVFVTAPVTEKNLLPGMTLDIARKRHLRELEEELGSSETSFAKEKNFGFAKQLIMDKLGLSEESAGDYLLSVGGKYGYDGSDVAEIIYDVLLAGDKEK